MTDITHYTFPDTIDYIGREYNIIYQHQDPNANKYKIIQINNGSMFCNVIFFENYDKFLLILNNMIDDDNKALLYYINDVNISYMIINNGTLEPSTRTVIL